MYPYPKILIHSVFLKLNDLSVVVANTYVYSSDLFHKPITQFGKTYSKVTPVCLNT